MALAPNTKEFTDAYEAFIEENPKTSEEFNSFFKDRNIDSDEFLSVVDDLVKQEEAGIQRPEPLLGFSPAKAVGYGVGRLGEAIGTLAGQAIEAYPMLGKGAREDIENSISKAADYVDDTLQKTTVGKAISTAAKETIDPKVNVAEEVAGFFLPFGLASRGVTAAAAGLKTASSLGSAAKAGAISVAADVLTRGEEEQFLPELIAMVPEAKPFAEALVIDPEDSVAEKRLKQTVDATLGAGVATVLLKSLGYAGGKTLAKAKALKKDKVTEPVEETVNKTPLEAKVVETAPNEYRQQGKIRETLGKVNTGLGRAFTSTAAMPKEMFDSYLKSRGFVEGMDMIVQGEAKKLDKLIKKTKSDPRLVNRLLEGDRTIITAKLLPEEVIEQTLKARQMIDDNQVLIRDTLNLADDSELALKLDDEAGFYLTRQFEFTTNPKWSKDIVKALKGQLKNTSGHNADVLEVVSNARTHIKKNNPKLTEAQVDGVIESIVKRGKKENQMSIITDMMSSGYGPQAAKVLKGRKDIDKPILELLGEVKDPIRNFRETMRNQNSLIAKSNFLNDVKAFAEKSLGKEVKTGGLFPFLPTQTATFLKQGEVGVTKNLGELAQKEMGKLGGKGEGIGLNKFTTTDDMYTMLERGIDTFGFDNPVGKGWLNVFAKPAGVAQAMETVFDHTAHMVNTYGMLQQLAMNGNLLRPSVFKNAQTSAYTLYQKAAKKDQEALAYLAKLKERGVIDSSVVAETIKKNVDRFGEGAEGALSKAAKAPFRGMSAVYGGVDDFGKVIAHKAEMNAYRKAFPEATEEEIFDYASNVVRNTMPSYTTAVPAVRALSRLPFGTYATFPAEVLRTQYNIIKIGLNDVRQGVATGNARLASTGLRRLSALGGTTAAIEYAINENNEELGVTPDDVRGINMVVPEYQRNTLKVMTKPITIDPKTGDLMTQFTDSGSLDAAQYVKGPIRAIIGRVMAGEDVSQREVDDVFKNAFAEVYGPFVSEKFLTTAMLNAYRGVDEEGRPIRRGLDAGDDIAATSKELGRILLPGSIKAGQKVLTAEQSEMLRGEGEGQTVAGFPMRAEEQKRFFTTGIRNNTMNLSKAMGFSMYEDGSEVMKSKDAFKAFLKQIPDRQLTPEDEQDIYNTYRKFQDIKREKMARLSDKVNVFRNMEYVDKEGNKKKVGLGNVVKASTSDAKYPIDKKLIEAVVRGKQGQGVFVPDSLSTQEYINLIKDRKFPFDVIKNLKTIEAEYVGQPLRPAEGQQ